MKCVAIGSCMLAAVNADVFGDQGFAVTTMVKASECATLQSALGMDPAQFQQIKAQMESFDINNPEAALKEMVEKYLPSVIPSEKDQAEIKKQVESAMEISQKNLSADEHQILKNMAADMEAGESKVLEMLSEVIMEECETKQLEILTKSSCVADKLFKDTTMACASERLYWINNEGAKMIERLNTTLGMNVLDVKEELSNIDTKDIAEEVSKASKIIEGNGEVVDKCAEIADNVKSMAGKKILALKLLSTEQKVMLKEQLSKIDITEQTAPVKTKVALIHQLLDSKWSTEESTVMKRFTSSEELNALKQQMSGMCCDKKVEYIITEMCENEEGESMVSEDKMAAMITFAKTVMN